MEPFVLPQQAHPRVGTSAPVAKIAPLDDLIPGVGDIPYIEGDFATHEVRRIRWQTAYQGRQEKKVERASLHRACCTFWEPNEEERLILAAGGSVQVLNFSEKQPLMTVGAMWLAPPQYPQNAPVIEAVARAMYETDRIGPPWVELGTMEQNTWKARARKANEVIGYWRKQGEG